MSQETAIYLTNIVIAVILAGLLTHAWVAQGRAVPTRHWMVAAWVIVVADVFFALRPEMPHWLGRLAPTLLVTAGQGMLLIAAFSTAKRKLPWGWVGVTLLLHAGLLIFFVLGGPSTPWRMVTNGVIWASLSIAAFISLRGAPAPYWKPIVSPATVFLLHGAFHLTRLTLAIAASSYDWPRVAEALQVVGDLEASFFIVALFTSLLLATLQQRHEELMSARAEVETLAGLLPICAWCKKIRDDAGYWQQVEDYFEQRDHIRFTHGICTDCMDEQLARDPIPPPPEQK